MSTESILEHLRSALAEVVSAEKLRLHQLYDKTDREHAERAEKLHPLLSALRMLASEVAGVPGVEIRLAEHGHMATIKLKSGGSSHTLSLSTSLANRAFTVEESQFYSFSGESSKHRHEFPEGEKALETIVNAIGKHVAQQAVLGERRK